MLIFLDIDGVMVAANAWRRPEILEDGFPEFSPKATKALNKIVSYAGAGIVLTTSHRFRYSLNEWHNIFKRRGINARNIKRLPENKNYLNRKDEILKWFVANHRGHKDFIIIDDDKSLNGLPDFYKDRLIQTSGSVGLTDGLADEALEIFKKENFEFI